MIMYEIDKILNTEHSKLQYNGIWPVMYDIVADWNFKKVLEFGTREGYSTRIFAEALKVTGGQIWTVDIEDPKWTPEEITGYPNVIVLKHDIKTLEWNIPVDILYIDDLHVKEHLLWELKKFGHLAKYVMCHDVCQSVEEGGSLLEPVLRWSFDNKLPVTVYPYNVCGLSVIQVHE